MTAQDGAGAAAHGAPWRVRPAMAADADALCALEAAVFGTRSWGADSVRSSIGAPGVRVILGESRAAPGPETRVRETPVEAPSAQGFVIWRSLGVEAEILTLGVLAAVRRAGLGAALLAAAADAARAAGVRRMFLEVDAGNPAAFSLYRRGGYVETGLRKGYYRDGADAVIMARDL